MQRQKVQEEEMERYEAEASGESPAVYEQKNEIQAGQDAARADMLNDINASA